MSSLTRKNLAMDALTKAEKCRRKIGLKMSDPACVYDIVEKYGLQVRFERIPGLEGLYNRERRVILLSSLRPSGRQRFNCAHEFGHYMYGHGVSVTLNEDLAMQMKRKNSSPDEYLVDRFASFLLMPKIAVKNGFVRRGWKPESATPEQIFVVAGWLGVGYTTLINHMQSTLSLISRLQARKLLRVQPRAIRAAVLGSDIAENLFIVDTNWSGRAVDIQVGDFIRIPDGMSFEGSNVRLIEDAAGYRFIYGIRSGLGRLFDKKSDWAAFVRVSKSEYVGLSAYRHWEDPDEEDYGD